MNAPIIRGLRRQSQSLDIERLVRMNAPIIRGLRRWNDVMYGFVQVRMNAPIIRGLRRIYHDLHEVCARPDECPDY